MPVLALNAVSCIPDVMPLRIDVSHSPQELANELDTLYGRLHSPEDCLYDLPEVETIFPDLILRYREADGEYYVYLEDVAHGRLAGYTVFNRLIEVGKRADPHVRAPHSKYAAPYQGRGLATAIYRWALDAGLCLVSGARQSQGANALWHSLARNYELAYVGLHRKQLTSLGSTVPMTVQSDLNTRMLLLGCNWTMQKFADSTGMVLPSAAGRGQGHARGGVRRCVAGLLGLRPDFVRGALARGTLARGALARGTFARGSSARGTLAQALKSRRAAGHSDAGNNARRL